MTATAVLSAAFLWGGLRWVLCLAAVVLILGVWLDQRVAVSFVFASFTERSHNVVPGD
jgi:hypothetical protein